MNIVAGIIDIYREKFNTRAHMKDIDVVCAGVSCLDITLSGNITPKIFQVDSTPIDRIIVNHGGDALNQAVTASTLGLRTALISFFGNDWKSEYLQNVCKKYSIITDSISMKQGDTVSSVVLVQDDGQRHFMFDRGYGISYTPDTSDMEILERAKVLSIGSLFVMPRFDRIGVPEMLQKAKSCDVTTILDLTCDTLKLGFSVLEPLLPFIDLFVPSYEEVSSLTGKNSVDSICEELSLKGANTIIIKMGEQGCYIYSKDIRKMVSPVESIDVVDTTGCGDSFVAACIYGLLQEWSLEYIALFANTVAGMNAMFLGASGHISSIESVISRISRYKK